MDLLVAALIVAAVTAVAVAAMLYVRRTAPEGSYFEDGDRASGVFGVLATGFAVLLGFVVFLSFANYDASRAGAEAESRLVAQQFETAQFFPAEAGRQLSGALVCYARAVVYEEWPRMESGDLSQVANPWAVDLFQTLRPVDPQTPAEQAAYGKWLDQTSDRENARADRLHGASGVIPSPLWLVLFVSALVLFAYILFFADSGERRKVQAMLMGGVAVVITSTMVLLWFLDNPYHGGYGALQPTAMERTLVILDEEIRIVGGEIPIPCDELGARRG